jgi:DNA polymerase III subunit delta
VKISANQLSQHLGKSLSSCYLVSGDEPLLVQEVLDAIRQKARQGGFDSRELHVATSGFDWDELIAAAGSMSLFAEKRIIELQLPTGKPGRQGSAAIVDMIARTGPDLLFIVRTPKLDRGTAASKWAKALEAAGVLVQIWPIGLRELAPWIHGRMRAAGLQPDRDAVRLIVDRVEGNLLAAQQEIEKLRLICGEGPVSAEDADTAVADSSRFDVYKLVDAAVAGDAKRAVRILGGVRAEGTEAVIVMWALTRELRVLAALADSVQKGADLGSALQKARVWQNRQSMVRSCVSRHAAQDFFALLKLARRADAAAKGQSGENAWQLATEIVLGLAVGRAYAA